MYEVGEYIVHPGQGVCKVEDVIENPEVSYMLMPVGTSNPMRISFPISGENRLRPVLSHDEAQELVDEYTDLSIDDYRSASIALEEQYYRDKIRRGTCLDSVRTVKTFRHRIDEAKANNKRPPVVYERILKQAIERSLEELSIALDMSKDDIVSLFESRESDVQDN
ncbi:CarD family transcriptional regulator [Olsenella sp. oral taxon 807]|jgi:hypothetical protein|uniref:CarD family transcriptional regulator n=1 Tax=Olsenella sp. oral taxon 807 TaxID=712411 RepID=UPI00067A0D37|nr:CarD family transcriptional regulator [Olsenella sp. oral taxon 807]AKT49504.1 CarD family transcriptional regulator [Olsenella sp. oral taxon 807]